MFFSIGLYHQLDGISNPNYKLLNFLTNKYIHRKKKSLAFNRDSCGHLALCLQLILLHYFLHRFYFVYLFRASLSRLLLELSKMCYPIARVAS